MKEVLTEVLTVLCFLALTSRAQVLSGDSNELVLILSNRGPGGSAAITVASRSLGPDNSRDHTFSEPLSPACSRDDLVTRCRNLSIIPIDNESPRPRYLVMAPLETKIGMKEFQYKNGSLMEMQTYEKSLVVDCTLLDIIVSGGQVLAPCLHVSPTSLQLHSCRFELNLTDLDSSDVSCPHLYNFPIQYPDLNYRYVTNFVYLSNYGGYFFAIHGDVYGINFGDEEARYYAMIGLSNCERLVRTGSSMFLAYCGPSQAVELNIPDSRREYVLDQDGIPFMCPSPVPKVLVREIDGTIFVTYGRAHSNQYRTGGNNITFGQCYRGDRFFFINDQGVGVLDLSSGSPRFLVNSSRTSHLVLFKGPYTVALKEDPQTVVLYDTSFQPVVRWEGRASAVGIIPDLTAPPTPNPTEPTPTPRVSIVLAVGLGVGLGAAAMLLVLCIAMVLICCCKKDCCNKGRYVGRGDPIGEDGRYRQVPPDSPPPGQDGGAGVVDTEEPIQPQQTGTPPQPDQHLPHQPAVHPPAAHDQSPDQEPRVQGPQDQPEGLQAEARGRDRGDGDSQSEESADGTITTTPVQPSTDRPSEDTDKLVLGNSELITSTGTLPPSDS